MEGRIVRPGDTRWPDSHRPWYWRHEHYHNELSFNFLAQSTSMVLINANFAHVLTVYEDTLVRVHFHSFNQRDNAIGWNYLLFRIYKGAAIIGRGGLSVEDITSGRYGSCEARALVAQTAAEGAVIYEVRYQVFIANRWTIVDAEWDIALCRDEG